ncbi:DUF6625 family protein [Secundilactobacillus yichangensis]|uniref:DUF6625 family protein n=1 Tax=Secundilactobacillus yichangensis TaxID=2799580 RepID=UPI001941BA5C|nr:DUF6625 family protein [Secundilactobacillus yichangensis]
MEKISLISPYFGNSFPSNFPILMDSFKHNSNINFIIPTDIDTRSLKVPSNVLFVDCSLEELKKRINKMLGYTAKIISPYKLVDFKPTYGELFASYLSGSSWWGYFDSDIIFGNISKFITEDILSKYDRIFNLGHLTLFRNCNYMNSLWRRNFNLDAVPSFKEVATNKTVYAFDEWGWGKNKGRGLSWAIMKTQNKVSQFDNPNLIADLKPTEFDFMTTDGVHINFIEYNNGNIYGHTDSGVKQYLYVHFQKRSLLNILNSIDEQIFIKPNVIYNCGQLFDSSRELIRWRKDQNRRQLKKRIGNLSISYLRRRLRFIGSEK